MDQVNLVLDKDIRAYFEAARASCRVKVADRAIAIAAVRAGMARVPADQLLKDPATPPGETSPGWWASRRFSVLVCLPRKLALLFGFYRLTFGADRPEKSADQMVTDVLVRGKR